MKVTKYSVVVGASILLAGFALIHVASGSGAADGQKDSAAKSDCSVGTVLMWWGAKDAVPAGWEICDGELPKTTGATLSGKKPDLVDRFPKGALANRKNISDLSQAVGGNHNMPALQIAKIDGLKVAEDGAHTHSPIQRAAAQSDNVDQADNEESTDVILARGKAGRKVSKADDNDDDDAAVSEGNHSHKLTGFVGSEKGVNADGDDRTGANQPAFSELFFIIRVK